MNPIVTAAIESCEQFVRGAAQAWALARPSCELAHAMVLACKAQRTLEIGTSFGLSSLWIGAALQKTGGSLITVEQDADKSRTAGEFIAAAGLSDVIRCEVGDARDLIRRLEGPFDFVLNDADKENCKFYVETIADRLPTGAVVLTDNISSHADELADFCEWIRREPCFFSTELSVGDGVELSIRR